MSDIQISKTETLSERKFPLKYLTFQLTSGGEKIDKENEIYFRPDAASVLLYNKESRNFLLTRQFRLATYLNGNTSGHLLEACAGLIDEGETPEQTARREAEEELGYKPRDIEQIGKIYSSAGGITEIVYLFIAPYNAEMKASEGGGLEEEGENITLIELGFDDARERLKQGLIDDAKTMMLLQHYFLFVDTDA